MTLMCKLTEAKILAACILRPDVFAYLADIEADHFAIFQHRIAWSTMRHLQAHDEPIDVLSICDAVAMRDLETESNWADKVNPAWMGALLCSTTDYTEEILFDHDVDWLRTLAARRAAL